MSRRLVSGNSRMDFNRKSESRKGDQRRSADFSLRLQELITLFGPEIIAKLIPGVPIPGIPDA